MLCSPQNQQIQISLHFKVDKITPPLSTTVSIKKLLLGQRAHMFAFLRENHQDASVINASCVTVALTTQGYFILIQYFPVSRILETGLYDHICTHTHAHNHTCT